MSGSCRRFISTFCLLAYLVASSPGYVTPVLWQPCDAKCQVCMDVKTIDACPEYCCAGEHRGEQEADRGDVGGCSCCGGQTSGLAFVSSSKHRGNGPSLPCNSNCPDGCYLCNAGAIPFAFMLGVVVVDGLDYLEAVKLGSFLCLCELHSDDLIRPPIC